MKKIPSLLLILSTFSVFGQDNFKRDLKNIVEIAFPVTPSYKIVGKDTVYFARKASCYYFALIKDFSTDREFALDKDSLDNFYTGIAQGAANKAKGALVSQTAFYLDGLKGIEYEFTADIPHFPNIRFERALYLNKKLVTISFWTMSDSLSINMMKKELFFSSFKINADKANTKQYTEPKDLLSKLQHGVGRTFPLVISGIMGACSIVLIILLIKRRNGRIRGSIGIVKKAKK